MNNVIKKVELTMKEYMKDNDGSHDFEHVERVRKISQLIATSIEYKDDDNMLDLLALLHDYEDHKYKKIDNISFKDLEEFLLHECELELTKVEKIIQYIPLISYSKNMKHITSSNDILPQVDIIVQIVSDADKIDALGAIGIARCFAYTGYTKQSLQKGIDHFEEKLFKLQYCMYTELGKQMAKSSTDIMKEFVNNYYKSSLSL